MNSGDGGNGNSSDLVNLMARSISIKQGDDMRALSRGERLHAVWKALEHLNILYLYQNMIRSHDFVE